MMDNDVMGEYVEVRPCRIDVTDVDDIEPKFTPWFFQMWDEENMVWRRGGSELPVSRAQYEAKCLAASMEPYGNSRVWFRTPKEILPYIVLMAALSAFMAVLALG